MPLTNARRTRGVATVLAVLAVVVVLGGTASEAALSFGGVSGTHLYTPAFLDLTDSFSLFVRFRTTSPNEQTLVSICSDTISGTPIFRVDTLGTAAPKRLVYATVFGGGGSGTITPVDISDPLNDGAWHWVAVVFNGGNDDHNVYVDSADSRVHPNFAASFPGSIRLGLGNRMTDTATCTPGAGGYAFDGELGEVQLYNTALHLSQLLDLARGPVMRARSHMLVYATFDAGDISATGVIQHSGTGAELKQGATPAVFDGTSPPVVELDYQGEALDFSTSSTAAGVSDLQLPRQSPLGVFAWVYCDAGVVSGDVFRLANPTTGQTVAALYFAGTGEMMAEHVGETFVLSWNTNSVCVSAWVYVGFQWSSRSRTGEAFLIRPWVTSTPMWLSSFSITGTIRTIGAPVFEPNGALNTTGLVLQIGSGSDPLAVYAVDVFDTFLEQETLRGRAMFEPRPGMPGYLGSYTLSPVTSGAIVPNAVGGPLGPLYMPGTAGKVTHSPFNRVAPVLNATLTSATTGATYDLYVLEGNLANHESTTPYMIHEFAASLGGFVATPVSVAEATELQDLAAAMLAYNPTPRVWLGISDVRFEGVWVHGAGPYAGLVVGDSLDGRTVAPGLYSGFTSAPINSGMDTCVMEPDVDNTWSWKCSVSETDNLSDTPTRDPSMTFAFYVQRGNCTTGVACPSGYTCCLDGRCQLRTTDLTQGCATHIRTMSWRGHEYQWFRLGGFGLFPFQVGKVLEDMSTVLGQRVRLVDLSSFDEVNAISDSLTGGADVNSPYGVVLKPQWSEDTTQVVSMAVHGWNSMMAPTLLMEVTELDVSSGTITNYAMEDGLATAIASSFPSQLNGVAQTHAIADVWPVGMSELLAMGSGARYTDLVVEIGGCATDLDGTPCRGGVTPHANFGECLPSGDCGCANGTYGTDRCEMSGCCSGAGTCDRAMGTCVLCQDGRAGPECEAACDPCVAGQGTCFDGVGGNGTCGCAAGYGGSNCEAACPALTLGSVQVLCGGRGECDDGSTGTGKCRCEAGWTGPGCTDQVTGPSESLAEDMVGGVAGHPLLLSLYLLLIIVGAVVVKSVNDRAGNKARWKLRDVNGAYVVFPIGWKILDDHPLGRLATLRLRPQGDAFTLKARIVGLVIHLNAMYAGTLASSALSDTDVEFEGVGSQVSMYVLSSVLGTAISLAYGEPAIPWLARRVGTQVAVVGGVWLALVETFISVVVSGWVPGGWVSGVTRWGAALVVGWLVWRPVYSAWMWVVGYDRGEEAADAADGSLPGSRPRSRRRANKVGPGDMDVVTEEVELDNWSDASVSDPIDAADFSVADVADRAEPGRADPGRAELGRAELGRAELGRARTVPADVGRPADDHANHSRRRKVRKKK